MRSNQNGFGIVGALIVIILLVSIGGVGYYVLSNSKADKSPENSQTTPITNPALTQASSEEYLNIPEFGVKLKTKHANKLSYVFKNQSNTLLRSDNQESDAWVEFSFKPEFVDDDKCSPGVNLFRLLPDASPSGDYFNQVGSRYYVFDGGPGACSIEANNPDDLLKIEVLQYFEARNLEAL